MSARKARGRSRDEDKLKDEVYRRMFRLEANRPGAHLDLAIALLRGWLAACVEPEPSKISEWLKKVSPICLVMIEAARQPGDAGKQCVQ